VLLFGIPFSFQKYLWIVVWPPVLFPVFSPLLCVGVKNWNTARMS
jgi:hypothetical protein